MSYQYWQAALKGENPPAFVDSPQPGFYRMKRGNIRVPVAVWPKGNGLEGPEGLGFKIGSEIIGHNMGTELWSNYCAHPITEDTYRAVAERGEDWPDADPTVAKMLANGGKRPNPELEAWLEQEAIAFDASHEPKEPEPLDPTEEFKEQIATAKAGAGAYTKIETDEANTRAASLRNMLLKLAGDAKKAGEDDYGPHYREYKARYDKWKPIVEEAEAAAKTIRKAMEGYQDDLREAARQAAERVRKQQEDAARAAAKAAAEGRPVEPPHPMPPPSNLPPPASQVRPTFGKAANVGSYMEVQSVDLPKFIEALRPRPEWATVEAYFRELAQKLANKGVILDGVTAIEKSKVR